MKLLARKSQLSKKPFAKGDVKDASRLVFHISCFSILFVVFIFFQLFLLGGFIVFGISQWSLWPQVTDLWAQGRLLDDLHGHPHYYRYMISLPGLWLGDQLGSNIGQSLYLSAIVMLNTFIFYSVFKKIFSSTYTFFFACSCFFALHFLMNGRGIFTFCSWLFFSLLVAEVFKVDRFYGVRNFLKVVLLGWLAIFIATVSAGVFALVYAGLLSLVPVLCKRLTLFRVMLIINIIFMLFWFSDYLFLAFEKNVNYFGSYLGLFNHGYGGGVGGIIFFGVLLLIIMLVWSFGVFASAGSIQMWLRLVGMPLLGGALGYSIMALALPGMMLLAAKAIERLWDSLRLRLQSVVW
ncbi:hypothetical protein [Stutzerimonas frequens]|uniref:hypothetical protein n=1 Tax=Stutzerimonas frequens TaxID=2968969 RepID=UPI0037495A16